MSTDTGHFDLTRSMPLTPDRLWHLLTDGQMREAWGAPEEGMVLTMDKSDFRVGGHETHRCGPADNPEFTVDTRWYRIEGPHDATFTETVNIGGAAHRDHAGHLPGGGRRHWIASRRVGRGVVLYRPGCGR